MMSFAIFITAMLGSTFFPMSLVNILILFSVVGIYMGIFAGSRKSYISEISHPSYKATALGTVATLIGIITLPSSLIAGPLWVKFGPSATFVFSAIAALVALSMFVVNRIKTV